MAAAAGRIGGVETSDRMMTHADRRHLLQTFPAAWAALGGCASGATERPGAMGTRFARVSSIVTRPGRLAEAAALFRDAVLPALQAQAGFLGAQLLTDEASQRGMTITLWASDAELRGSERDGRFRQQVQLLGGLLVAAPQRQDYVAHLLP
jgi:heme-degrading monooxygenase HmoA